VDPESPEALRQPAGVLDLEGPKTQPLRRLEVLLPVVEEQALFRIALREIQGKLVGPPVGLSRPVSPELKKAWKMSFKPKVCNR